LPLALNNVLHHVQTHIQHRELFSQKGREEGNRNLFLSLFLFPPSDPHTFGQTQIMQKKLPHLLMHAMWNFFENGKIAEDYRNYFNEIRKNAKRSAK